MKSPARLAWLQGLGATGTTAAGLWLGRGDGSRVVTSQHSSGLVPAHGWQCPPCRAGANSSAALYSVHIPAELVKAGAGNVPGGLCHPGNIQGQEHGHGQRVPAVCAGCGVMRGAGGPGGRWKGDAERLLPALQLPVAIATWISLIPSDA